MNQPTSASPAARLRVLYVEDNDYLREVIGMLLEEEELDVVSCGSGEEGEQLFASQTFDMVITDVSLPQMSGTELARRIQQASPATWVVFSSGYAIDHWLASFGPRARALAKPFETDQLQALIREVQASRHTSPAVD